MKTKSMKIVDNKIYMGNYSLEELGKKYGTPLYVYDEIGLVDKINRYKNSFKSDKYDCRVVYASKAFICPRLASILRERNVYIDAISTGDLYLLKQSNYPMEMVVLHGNNKSYAELTEAVESNIGYVVVDNYHELKLLKKLLKLRR